AFLSLFFKCPAIYRYLHAFPTRRSSDLVFVADIGEPVLAVNKQVRPVIDQAFLGKQVIALQAAVVQLVHAWFRVGAAVVHLVARSEEHTSELQSRENLVCRLLLEKKKRQ